MFSALFACLMYSEIPISEIAGMSSCMNQGYELYAPSVGCLYWKIPYLFNLCKYGPEKSAMVKLVHSLFFIQLDNITFAITASPIKIAYYFTPDDIGKILGSIAWYQKKMKEYQFLLVKDLEVKEERALDVLSKNINTLIAKLKKTLSNIVKNMPETRRKNLKDLEKKGQWAQIRDDVKDIKIESTSLQLSKQVQQLEKYKHLQEINDKLKREFKNSVKQILQDIVANKIKEIKDAIIKSLSATIARNERQAEKLFLKLKEKAFFKKMQDYQPEVLIKELEKIEMRDTTVELLLQAIRKIEKNKKLFAAEEKESEKLVNPFLLKEIEENFAKIVLEALQEEEQEVYPKGVTIGLFLAWLWKYSASKKDIENYLVSLSDALMQEVFDTTIMHSKKYSKQTYEELKAFDVNSINKLILSNPNIINERIIFARYGYDLYDKIVPDEVPMNDHVESICKETFPDCGETSLRNFFNALVYDYKTGQFNSGGKAHSLLHKLNAKKELIEFYEKYKTPEYMTSIAEGMNVYNDWARVVSGLQNVKYNNPDGCEISSGVFNMLAVIENLLPGVKTFEDLKKKLAKYNIVFDIEWDDEPTIANDKNNKAEITIQKSKQEKFTLKWEFFDGHFVLSYTIQDLKTYFENYRTALTESIPQFSLLMRWPYIMLDAAFDTPVSGMLALTLGAKVMVSRKNIYLLSHTKTIDEQLQFAKKIMTLESSIRNPMLLKIFSKLQDDPFASKNFIKTISPIINEKIKTNGVKQSFYKVLMRVAHDDSKRYGIIMNLLDQELSMDVALSLSPQLSKIEDSWMKTGIIKLILGLKKPQGKDGKKIMQILYDSIAKILPTIEDDWSKSLIMSKILGRSIHSDSDFREVFAQYYRWIEQTLPTIKHNRGKVFIVEAILELASEKGKQALIKRFFPGAVDTLPTLNMNDTEKQSIVKKIMEIDLTAVEDELATYGKLFEWAQQNKTDN